jgi:predicted nuclease of predicted toxin-antitoxin system
MKLLLDENVDARLLPVLVSQGHDVKSVLRDYPASLDDETILGLAVQEDRVVITPTKTLVTLFIGVVCLTAA